MSAMLMRNYQKLIKIKKGPKVKDLLITVPCKSRIIHSHESEPNTTETGRGGGGETQRRVGCTYLTAHGVGGLHLTATVQAQSGEIRRLAEAPTSRPGCSRTGETQDSRAGLQRFMRGAQIPY